MFAIDHGFRGGHLSLFVASSSEILPNSRRPSPNIVASFPEYRTYNHGLISRSGGIQGPPIGGSLPQRERYHSEVSL